MLIEKKDGVAVNDTIGFRLSTGEEVIAKLVAQDDGSITVSKPVIVQMQMVGPSEARLGFLPFMLSGDEGTTKFRIVRDRLVTDPFKPRADVGSQYVKMTTGLDIPTGGLLKV
jgi:hypothetical protein